MCLEADSLLSSSSNSRDDLAEVHDGGLDSAAYTSLKPEVDEDKNIDDSNVPRINKHKVELVESVSDPLGATSIGVLEQTLEKSVKDDVSCPHPGVIAGMCIRCGQKIESQWGVPFRYIHKDLRLSINEVNRLRDRDLKSLLQRKKLYLVLDLDHTLLNSADYKDLTEEEEYLRIPTDSLNGSLFKLESMKYFTKLRPFVHTFLKEASELFEMHIYTMGKRAYAMEMVNLLDPQKVYFESRVIARGEGSRCSEKGLDVFLGQESAVVILDDTKSMWTMNKANLILMERYHFFASSCKKLGPPNSKSLSQQKTDESDVDGPLAAVLEVLKRVHTLYFHSVLEKDLPKQDVRQILQKVRREVLKGCKLVFSCVEKAEGFHHLWRSWKMAEELGATCSKELDSTVTHVISGDVRTKRSRWVLKENKFVVSTKWIEASNSMWQRQPEENFPVTEKEEVKTQVNEKEGRLRFRLMRKRRSRLKKD